MGTNKTVRKKIQGELEVINLHLKWIDDELAKPYPDRRAIAKWENDIARHLRILANLETKLPGKKRGKS